jgi:hypothetical protein
MPSKKSKGVPVGRRRKPVRINMGGRKQRRSLNKQDDSSDTESDHTSSSYLEVFGVKHREILFEDPDSIPIPTTSPDPQQSSNASHRKAGKRRGDKREENKPPATDEPSTTNETKKGKKQNGSKTKNPSKNRESKKSRQNKKSTKEKKKAEEVEEEGEPIARSIRRVQKARDKVSRAQWKLSPLALKYFTKGMHDKPDNNRSVQGLMNATATHFMNKPELTKLCIERANEKHMPCDSKIQNINCYTFVYECNILQNAHDTRQVPLRGESVLYEEYPAVISARTSDPAKALYTAQRNKIGASRYLSVIFPLNELIPSIDTNTNEPAPTPAQATDTDSIAPGHVTAMEKIKSYFNAFEDEVFKQVLHSIQTMAQYNSDINWTFNDCTRFDTSDYSTYLCEAEGMLDNINNHDDPVKYRVMIYRKIVLTGFKETEILTTGNTVMCEEVIIQLQTSGDSPSNDAVAFKNTESCLIFSARNSLNGEHTSMHFQGKGAFSVDIPSDGKFNPLRRDHDVMMSTGWLVNKINESTKNDDDSVGKAAAFFLELIKDQHVRNAAEAQAKRNKQSASEQAPQPDASPRDDTPPRPADVPGQQSDNGDQPDNLTIVENSFIAHQKTVLLRARGTYSSIHCIDWVSAPSFALVVLSPSSDDHIRYLVLKTYQIGGNRRTDEIASSNSDGWSYRSAPSNTTSRAHSAARSRDSVDTRGTDTAGDSNANKDPSPIYPQALDKDTIYGGSRQKQITPGDRSGATTPRKPERKIKDWNPSDEIWRDNPEDYSGSQFRSLITSSLPEELELELELI